MCQNQIQKSVDFESDLIVYFAAGYRARHRGALHKSQLDKRFEAMKKEPLHFTLYALIIYLTYNTLNPAVAALQPSGGSATHVCGVIDDQWNKRYSDQYPNRRYARTTAANLNVGEPRTVRLVYFLPNDRPYRADVIQRMKDEILNIQTFFAEQMEVHGYGEVTFRIETDSQDEPMVHDVIGKHPDSYYLDRTLDTVYPEIEEMFNLNANVYLIVIDNGMDTISYSSGRAAGGRGGRRGKSGGFVLLPSGFTWNTMVHELGHAFGLWHDFDDPGYIMSYGPGQDRLSACHADYLSVHPYFNSDTPIEEEQMPIIESISPRPYPAGAKRVSVQLKVSDPEGLHQVLLFVTTIKPHSAAGFLELKTCRGLEGEKDTIVEFDYDGVIPSDGFTSLSDPAGHPITIEAVDTDGNVSRTYFTLTEISPHHIAILDEHTAGVLSVSFSPDGTILASGSWDGTVKLWNVATRENVATLPHTAEVLSVSFSTNGEILASGSVDGTVKLWDVATRENIATLPHGAEVLSVSFSTDGTLASGAYDGTVKLWDVATQQSITTLDEHTGVVSSVLFSTDGTLASGSWDGTVKLWDVVTRENVATLPHTAEVLSVSFSTNGEILASGSWDGTVKLWDVATRENIATLPHGARVRSVSFSTDGTLASGAHDGTVKLWDVTKRINFATLWHTSPVGSVSFSGTILASATDAGMVELRDSSEWRQARLEALAAVDIPDSNLRAAIEKALGKAPGDTIIALDMENLTRLAASEVGIMNLTGLEDATNLTVLYLHRNSITDISVVADLTKLTELFIWGNNISDMSAVSRLTRLTKLGLGSNPIRDISAVSGLTNLTELYLGRSSIRDISAVSGLTNLTKLHLWDNSITDISAVSGLTNLTELYLENNFIRDISVVSRLTNLTKLSIWGNSVSDISPLVANTGLGSGDEILLQRNPLSYLSIHTHIPTLQSRGVTVKFDNRAHPVLSKVSGDNQEGMPNETLAKLFVVEARDAHGSPLVGVSVTFTVVAGGGTLSVTNTTTDGKGRAESTLTLGPNPGTNRVKVSVEGISQTAVFSAEVTPPPPIPTTLEYVSGDNQSGLIGETLMQPFAVKVHDQYDDPMEGVTVTFVVSIGGGSLSDTSVDTDPNGLAQSTLTLGSEPGTNTVEASVEGLSQMAVFSAEASLPPLEPTVLSIVSGDNQNGLTGEALANPFVVEVRDQYDDPMAGVTVTFAVSGGGGSLSDTSVDTDPNGLAQSTLTLGSEPGTNTVEASVEGLSQMAVFSAEASLPPPEPTVLSIVSGDNQNGLTGEALANPFVVEVRDQYDDPVAGVTVTFAVSGGGGSLSDISVDTDANGLAQSTLTLGSAPGTNTVEASVEGLSQMVVFNAEASLPPPEPTVLSIVSGDNQNGLTGEALANPFVVEVRDQYDDPMAGVTVTFTVLTGGSSLSLEMGVTDANGQAESTLTLGIDPGTNTVKVSVEGISEMAVFSAEASLPPPEPTVLSIVSGDNQNGLTGEALANPFVVEVRDQYDDPMAGVTVTFTVLTGGSSLSLEMGVTDANGQAESTLTLGIDPGTNTVEVSVEGISEMAVFSAEASLPPPEPTVLSIVSGDNQNGLTGEALANPFVVEVRDQYDDPMAGVTVTFTVLTGGSSLSLEMGVTDANGQAESTLTLGIDPGTNTVEVSVEGISEMAVFSAEASLPPPEPTVLSIVSGDNQNGLTGEVLANPFVVEVYDQYDDPMEGVTVTFAVSIGGGSMSDTSVDSDVNGLARSTLTLGSDPVPNIVEVSVEGIAETVTFHAVAKLLDFDLALPSGISLIHVPLRVIEVDGREQTIESIAELYDALGGASSVNFLITYDSQTQEWLNYFVPSDKGTPADRRLTDDLGIIAGMKSPTSVRLKGDALGTDGSSTIALNQGLNLVALPLNNSRINRVSDLFALDGIGGNVPVIILTDGGEFKAVGRAGDPGDIAITGGQSFILTAQRAAIVEISGDAWTNVSGTSAAPQVALTGIEVGNTTPVLGLRGSIVDEGTGLKAEGFRVTIKNLSTGKAVATVPAPDETGYRSTVVDIETGRAAQIGNILEISVQSPNPFIGVEPLRYTVTAEDVKQSLIQLPELVAYEIPAETELLSNYPNPFNPETWIPYRLAEDAFVALTIYDRSGQVVRTLEVGHRIAAVYENRSKAIYWDGKNEFGETVASGVYFYHLSAGDYSATRKMVILK